MQKFLCLSYHIYVLHFECISSERAPIVCRMCRTNNNLYEYFVLCLLVNENGKLHRIYINSTNIMCNELINKMHLHSVEPSNFLQECYRHVCMAFGDSAIGELPHIGVEQKCLAGMQNHFTCGAQLVTDAVGSEQYLNGALQLQCQTDAPNVQCFEVAHGIVFGHQQPARVERIQMRRQIIRSLCDGSRTFHSRKFAVSEVQKPLVGGPRQIQQTIDTRIWAHHHICQHVAWSRCNHWR